MNNKLLHNAEKCIVTWVETMLIEPTFLKIHKADQRFQALKVKGGLQKAYTSRDNGMSGL